MSAAGKRLSIGIVTPTLSRSGGGIFPIVRAHAKGLHSLADVRVYGLCDEAAKEDIATLCPVEPNCYWPAFSRFGYAPAMSRDLACSHHDIVHQHGLWQYPSIAVSRWRRKSRRPTVISTQGMLEPWAVANSAARKRAAAALFERRNLESAACLHCSEAEVPGIRAYGLRNPIAVIPNGIDVDDNGPPSMPRPKWMEGKRHLLFLGRIHPKKGLVELINAWALARQRETRIAREWTLAIAGWDDGGHEANVRRVVKDLGLEDKGVIFTGPLFGEDKTAAFAHADAFVLPSYSEGFPMSVLEAWAHSLPVLMTRECNMPAAFEAGAAIEIKRVPELLAQALTQTLLSANLDRLGANGLSLVKGPYSWPTIVAQLMEVYSWLAGRAVKPSFVHTA